MNAVPTNVIERLTDYETDSVFEDLTMQFRDEDDMYNVDYLPMWGTMFEIQMYDTEWFESHLEFCHNLGIRVFRDPEGDFNLLLGIDGAGYSFYDEHWIPLYCERFDVVIEPDDYVGEKYVFIEDVESEDEDGDTDEYIA